MGEIINQKSVHLEEERVIHKYKKLEAFLNAILETIDVSCTVIDENKHVLIWTKKAEQLFSIKKETIIGKPITDFFKENELEIIHSLKNGTSVHHKQHFARENLIVLINSRPVKLDGKIIGAVVSETDITNQVRLNRELFTISEKVIELERKVEKYTESENPFVHIKGHSKALQDTINKTKKVATTPANLLILGESGVGKELFAKAIHTLREQPHAPFIPINCGAIPSSLFESEMFGYEKGAFSGADHKGKKGKIELARGGTLFLDEIGEMPIEMQVKLLRALQEKKYFPVGGTKEIEVDFRIVAATNQNLFELVNKGEFREDLYYRLNVVSLHIPPLRERPEDIIELAHYFMYECSVKYNRPIHGVSQEVMHALLQYHWPGNIRELRNVIERLVVMSDNGKITLADLPFEQGFSRATPGFSHQPHSSLNKRLEFYEKEIILSELEKVHGNKKLCAANLQITRATLYNRIKKLNIKV